MTVALDHSDRVFVILLVLGVAAAAFIPLSGLVAGQDYYNSSNTTNITQDQDSWLGGVDTSVSGIMTLLGRSGAWLLGGGVEAPSGASAGALGGGVVLGGMMLGMAGSARVGSVAGAVLGISGLAAITAIDAAPGWLYVVGLFGLGLVASAVLQRQLR